MSGATTARRLARQPRSQAHLEWCNWAGDQVCTPMRIEQPAGEDELCSIVAGASAEGLTVRAVGSGHSFTACACTDGVLINMRAMRRILAVDLARQRVTVQGGITLHEFGPVLAAYGLSLENQGDIDGQTITGAISTGTHGTGARFASLSSQIVGLRLVLADGTVLELDADADDDRYLAARVSLGTLGVVSAVTVQCVPLYTLHRTDAPRPLRRVLSGLDALVDGDDHFEFFVFPYTDRALTRTSRRTDAVPNPPLRWKRWVDEELVQNFLLGGLCRLGRAAPILTPTINRTISRALSAAEVEDRAHRVYATRRRVRFAEMEYAIPRAAAAEAVTRVLAVAPRHRLPILFPIEVRFAAGDAAFLSTAHERDSCYVAVHQYAGMEFDSYFRAVEGIMDAYGGRPHWGKRHYQTASTLQDRYPQWDRFQATRRVLDPNGTFANDYSRAVLGA